MLHFEDYHRTIVGSHGTRLSVALDIVNRRREFEAPENEGDWLGRGIYFWEYARRQAEWWANRIKQRKKWDEPIAILGSMIRLGSCLDTLVPLNMKMLKDFHGKFCADRRRWGQTIPENKRAKRNLDCAVFEFLYAALESPDPGRHRSVDTARGVYVPTDENK